MDPILEAVKKQYEKFPYPKFSWLAGIKSSSVNHATFENGSRLVRGKTESHQGKVIGLFGCGTNEALAFGAAQKKAELHAVDISEKAVAASRLRCKIRGIRNVQIHCDDLVAFANRNHEKFDYIHAYGVLHHLENPLEGFHTIAPALKPDGFARIMVYSKASRFRIQLLQKVLRLLGYSPFQKNVGRDVRTFVKTLPENHPLRLTFEKHPEIKSEAGIVDAFLHTQEHSFSIDELLETLEASGLQIRSWEFSDQIQNFLDEAPGNTATEKIRFLEAFDQFPTSFKFWVTRASISESPILGFPIHGSQGPGSHGSRDPGKIINAGETTEVFWEPFHRAGLSAYRWVEKNIPKENADEFLEQKLESLSVPYGLPDLDPAPRIMQTLKDIRDSQFQVLTVEALQSKLSDYIPILTKNAEHQNALGLWHRHSQILQKYQVLSPWKKLELLEALFGLTKSQTTLKFHRIDGPRKHS